MVRTFRLPDNREINWPITKPVPDDPAPRAAAPTALLDQIRSLHGDADAERRQQRTRPDVAPRRWWAPWRG